MAGLIPQSGLRHVTLSTHLFPCVRWTPALCVTTPWQWPGEAPEEKAARLWCADEYREHQVTHRRRERPGSVKSRRKVYLLTQ